MCVKEEVRLMDNHDNKSSKRVFIDGKVQALLEKVGFLTGIIPVNNLYCLLVILY